MRGNIFIRLTTKKIDILPKTSYNKKQFKLMSVLPQHKRDADELGSGMRNTYKYTQLYSGGTPEFIEGDVFRTIIPLTTVAVEKVGPLDPPSYPPS